MKASDFFDIAPDHPIRSWFSLEEAPWAWLPQIKDALAGIESRLPASVPPGLHIEGPVFFEGEVKLPPFGSITGPAWIGNGCELRPGVYIRGNVFAGRNCVLGNSCEYKNCILLDHVQTPHYNYIGDSVLGNRAHLGAGSILSNLRFDQKPVVVRTAEGSSESGLRKFGAILGDGAEAGCNVVLQPGTVLDRNSAVAPGLAYGGYLEAENIAFWKPSFRKLHRSVLER
ncbi:LbetaH domain-containing protein [Puniceicoccus vermicola]|uniref:UDP-N-acetylglucosamine diphosphorylase n=1 Tax=Puniceicoccus vermicola TaxID=388746 RepID=A0A7X1E4R6_9BACT|nr:UDP-N-acetylglucosamine diphosphorylase [Puniceicoccus vermicola]MBC2600892.1 UDP-N-acetylglucosamine diphosphorylase [Puniceicoccus vermicola]